MKHQSFIGVVLSRMARALCWALPLVLSACSYKVTVRASDADIAAQARIFEGVAIGHERDDLLSRLPAKTLQFELVENDELYQYYSFHNPKTRIDFGFLFRAGKLASVISGTQVAAAFSCRTPFRTRERHWLTIGIEPYFNWFVGMNRLGEGFDPAVSKEWREERKTLLGKLDQAAATPLTLVAYSPFIVLAAPMLIADSLKEKPLGLTQQQWLELAESLPLGSEKEHVITTLSVATQRTQIGNMELGTYFHRYYTVGFVDDKLAFREPISMMELARRQKGYGIEFYGDEDCSGLEPYWAKLSASDVLPP